VCFDNSQLIPHVTHMTSRDAVTAGNLTLDKHDIVVLCGQESRVCTGCLCRNSAVLDRLWQVAQVFNDTVCRGELLLSVYLI
jgi:hypothetical protein